MAELTKKQKMFIDEYLIDLNATQAAIRAGYSNKNASRIAIELLNKTHVSEYLNKRMNDRENRTEITQDKVIQELAKIAFDDMKNYLKFYTDENTGELKVEIKDSDTIDTRNISEVSISPKDGFKFKLYSKENALVQLGKHLGIFTDKLDIKANIGVSIIDDIGQEEEENE